MEFHVLVVDTSIESVISKSAIHYSKDVLKTVIFTTTTKTSDLLNDLIFQESVGLDSFKTPFDHKCKFDDLLNKSSNLSTILSNFNLTGTVIASFVERFMKILSVKPIRPLLLYFDLLNNSNVYTIFGLVPIISYCYLKLNKGTDGFNYLKSLEYICWTSDFLNSLDYVSGYFIKCLLEQLDELLSDGDYLIDNKRSLLDLTVSYVILYNVYKLNSRNFKLTMYKNISRFIYRIRNELSTYFIHSYVPSSLHLADCSSPPEIVLPSAPLFSCPSASLRSAAGSPLEVSTEVQSSTLQPRSLGVDLPFGDRKLEEATTASGREVDSTSSGGPPCNGKDGHTLQVSSSGDHELNSTFFGDDINVTLNSYLSSDKSFHLTAAIVYANGLPHIGHAYEAVSCDVIARFYRLFGRDVLFSVGTDEHGQKVMTTAMKEGKRPIEICDYYSSYLKNKYKELLISNSIFLRTTDKRHHKIATAIWNKILSNGDIYLGEYNGWYSIREERFIPNTEALITDYKDPCTGKPYDNMTEPSYFFTMEKYRSKLIQHINNNPYFIRPDRTRNEVLSRLQNPLEDLSISRTSFKWGIPVPNDNQHVMYVWMDALTNYITGSILYHQHKQNIKNTTTIPFCTNTNPLEVQSNSPHPAVSSSNYLPVNGKATHGDRGEGGESKGWTSSGIPESDPRELEGEVKGRAVCKTTSGGLASGVEDGDVFMFDDFDRIMCGVRWPPDIQVIGKDISWFHCVILPCILMSLGLELPKTLYSHGFIKSSTGMKMSKSFGNVISIDYLLDNYGVEAFRYFVMRSNSFGSDINFDLINLVDLFNSELADNIGNLIHRLTNLTSKYCNGVVPIMENVRVKNPIDTVGILNTIIKSMELYDIQMAIITCINGFKECNLYLTKCAPWFCNDEKIRNCYIRVLLEAVYFLSHFLIPIIPNTSIKIFNKFNTKPKDHILQLSTNYNNLIDGTKIDIGDILFNKLTHDNN